MYNQFSSIGLKSDLRSICLFDDSLNVFALLNFKFSEIHFLVGKQERAYFICYEECAGAQFKLCDIEGKIIALSYNRFRIKTAGCQKISYLV